VLEVVGLVVARQRPQAAKGFVFILMEDETGMTNVIVHPDVYERDRLAIRGEPFLWVKGKLAKDDGTLNVIAEEVRGLTARRLDGAAATRPAGEDSLELPAGQPPSRPTALLRSLRAVAPSRRNRRTGGDHTSLGQLDLAGRELSRPFSRFPEPNRHG